MERGGRYTVPPLPEELLAADSCAMMESQFSLAGGSCFVDCAPGSKYSRVFGQYELHLMVLEREENQHFHGE